jgi:hypothetical protein
VLSKQVNHGNSSEAATEPPEEFPPIHQAHRFGAEGHRLLLR